VLLAFPENAQCSHSNHWRDCRYFQFHVSFPHCGHVSGCGALGATHGTGAIGGRRGAAA
jgi:hypothetical protein